MKIQTVRFTQSKCFAFGTLLVFLGFSISKLLGFGPLGNRLSLIEPWVYFVDIPQHLIASAGVSYFILAFTVAEDAKLKPFFIGNHLQDERRAMIRFFILLLGLVLVVGVFWEAKECFDGSAEVFIRHLSFRFYLFDCIKDLLADLCGVFLAVLLGLKVFD